MTNKKNIYRHVHVQYYVNNHVFLKTMSSEFGKQYRNYITMIFGQKQQHSYVKSKEQDTLLVEGFVLYISYSCKNKTATDLTQHSNQKAVALRLCSVIKNIFMLMEVLFTT